MVNLVIQDKTDAEMLPMYTDPSEMMLAHEVDRRFHCIDPKGTSLLESVPNGIEEQSKRRVLAAKVIVDAVALARVRLIPLGESPITGRAAPQGRGPRHLSAWSSPYSF